MIAAWFPFTMPGQHHGSQGSILEISPYRSVKSPPVSARTESGRQSGAFSHRLDPEAPPLRPERHVSNSIATMRR
jgi:hypothetical protein